MFPRHRKFLLVFSIIQFVLAAGSFITGLVLAFAFGSTWPPAITIYIPSCCGGAILPLVVGFILLWFRKDYVEADVAYKNMQNKVTKN